MYYVRNVKVSRHLDNIKNGYVYILKKHEHFIRFQ